MDDKGILYNNECEIKYVLKSLMGLPGGSVVKNMPAKAGHVVSISGSLGQEDPQEKEMATDSSVLAWEVPWTEEPGRLQSMGSQRVGHN